MPYSTEDDIKKLIPEETLIQLTDDEGLGVLGDARLTEAVLQADAEINSYLGERYSVPFTTVPAVVKKLSVDIAIYNLYSRLVDEMPGVRAERYKNAVRQLEGMSRGIVSLGLDPAPAAASDGHAETNKAVDENVFSRDKLKGF